MAQTIQFIFEISNTFTPLIVNMRRSVMELNSQTWLEERIGGTQD